MSIKLLFLCIILVVLTVAALAADVAGKWVYEEPGHGGGTPGKTSLSLKADGDKLTGKISTQGRNSRDIVNEIKDGKVDGNKVFFKTEPSSGGRTVREYTGRLSGDELNLKIILHSADGNTTTQEVTAKRSSN